MFSYLGNFGFELLMGQICSASVNAASGLDFRTLFLGKRPALCLLTGFSCILPDEGNSYKVQGAVGIIDKRHCEVPCKEQGVTA